METINKQEIKTVVLSFSELLDMEERTFCEALYSLTESAKLPEMGYQLALKQINAGMAYEITDEDDPVNKIRSWIDCLRFFKRNLTDSIIGRIGEVKICFEYQLRNRWIDAVIVCNDKIIILEFKSGTTTREAVILKYIRQVNKYYNRVSHQNRGVVEAVKAGILNVEKYLVFTNEAVIGKVEQEDFIITKDTFQKVLASVSSPCTREELEKYLDTTSFFDPSIGGVLKALLETGIINYVNANSTNVQACETKIKEVLGRNHRELGIIIVKGGPGTGKTGTAFTLLANHIGELYKAQYATGNQNLEKNFTEMVNDAVRNNTIFKDYEGIAESFIGHVNTLYNPKNYCDIYLRNKKDVNPITVDNDIILIDEAQRLWDSLNIAVRTKRVLCDDQQENDNNKKVYRKVNEYSDDEQEFIYGNNLSESYLILHGVVQGIIQQGNNKVVVLFVGNGQEINKGEENGEKDIISAICAISQLAANHGICLRVYSPDVEDIQALANCGVKTELVSELKLIDNQRNDEGDPVLDVVTSILENTKKPVGVKNLYRVFDDFNVIYESIKDENDDDEYSIGLLINSYDTWSQKMEEGNTKKTVSVYRFTEPHDQETYCFKGIKNEEIFNFLQKCECNKFEHFASQFDSQGLELDDTVVIWGDTLRWRKNRWEINNSKINEISRYRGIWWHCHKVNELIDRVPNPPNRKPAKKLDFFKVREQFVKNAYRVLLTRARQYTYLYVQDTETYNHLKYILKE